MNYLTYFGNHLRNFQLPESAEVLCAPPRPAGIPRREIPARFAAALEKPLGLPPLRELVNSKSKVLIAFDDNCQPFPKTGSPDFRRLMLETLLPMLDRCGVRRENLRLVCAVALHRKMKEHELREMVGPRIMREFFPRQLENSDAEDPENTADLEPTEKGEPVQVWKPVLDSDLVIYLDTIQIPLNGGHKSVAVGLGTYKSISNHHLPDMTATEPHVMQPLGSNMHSCIERISRVILKRTRVMVVEAALNNQTYPWHLRWLGKGVGECNFAERLLRGLAPPAMRLLPEALRRKIMRSIRSAYLPVEINAGAIDPVHERTLAVMKQALELPVERPYDTVVFGLPDLSPYAIGARLNPVLVVSDVLGYVANFFYNRPLIRKNGVLIILNPVYEVFHPEYHLPYRRFYEEVLAATKDPYEMKNRYQEKYARDEEFRAAYRFRYSHHGYHPFTVWYWATYHLKNLAKVILVGPPDNRAAGRLGVGWAPNLERALAEARQLTGGDRIAALTIPPFFYAQVKGELTLRSEKDFELGRRSRMPPDHG
jgi:hypothetical protein